MNDDAVVEQFDGRLTRMYVSISEDAVPSQSFVDEQIIDFSPTGKSRDVRLVMRLNLNRN